MLAEMGTNMDRFLTACHLISWVGLCPKNDESAGKRNSTRMCKGVTWLRSILFQCAWAGACKKDSYLQSVPSSARQNYGPIQKTLHWFVFLLVVFLYGITYVEEFFPRGDPGRAWIWWLHISFGLLLAAVLIVRIATRMRLGTPATVSSITPLEERVARMTHLLLYILIVAVVILGIVLAFYRGNELSFFGLFTIPSPIATDRATVRSIQELQNLGATALVILASFHAAAALWHHFIRRDEVLVRMLPGESA